jgi:hypothetical protein
MNCSRSQWSMCLILVCSHCTTLSRVQSTRRESSHQVAKRRSLRTVSSCTQHHCSRCVLCACACSPSSLSGGPASCLKKFRAIFSRKKHRGTSGITHFTLIHVASRQHTCFQPCQPSWRQGKLEVTPILQIIVSHLLHKADGARARAQSSAVHSGKAHRTFFSSVRKTQK